jgi:hypothetical protein
MPAAVRSEITRLSPSHLGRGGVLAVHEREQLVGGLRPALERRLAGVALAANEGGAAASLRMANRVIKLDRVVVTRRSEEHHVVVPAGLPATSPTLAAALPPHDGRSKPAQYSTQPQRPFRLVRE